ncbi:MFS transporter [Vibrio sp. STUT-A11]|uniref:MFS transporter n=1 Tax=unclassified Vibrio TaxID=2614977 RepID=UPI0022300D45|nr:MFS transporter [Vibrio sp. STUT-A11]BDR16589.1 MFS transporter [Vibrio sp. STUT-A11]
MQKNVNRFSFVGASLSLMVTYVTSAVPIPLYGTYQLQDNVSYLELSLSSVVYFIGAVTALVLFGRLSNHWGRKTVSIISLLLAALSVVVFLNVHSATPLILGRLLQGLACGLASTALASWLVDHAPSVPSWIPPAVISCGPMTGLTFGGVGSGFLIEYAPYPRLLPFAIAFCLIACCIVLVLKSQETMKRKPGAFLSLIPSFTLPASAKKAFPLAAVTFVCTWALGGFFQAFGPAMAHEQLHSQSAVAAALVFASIMAPSSIGASLAGRMAPSKAQFAGMLSFTVFVGSILLALQYGILSAFLAASICAGIAQGLVLTGSIGTMVSGLLPHERANVFSVIYATSYIGAAVPTFISGQLSEQFSLLQIACGYGVLALFGSVVLLFSRMTSNQKQTAGETS